MLWFLKAGEGYTEFKRRRNEQEEATLKNKKTLIESRVRPGDVQYYIPSPNFNGWKKDYIFTTRDYGTGYYWDGMDSARESLGIWAPWLTEPLPAGNSEPVNCVLDQTPVEHELGDDQIQQSTKKKKKKDKSTSFTNTPVADTSNPLEQVFSAILRRNVATMSTPIGAGGVTVPEHERTAALAAARWATAQDPSSRKTYYYHTVTRETRWDYPISVRKSTSTGKNEERPLPSGWSIAKDNSGKDYYYHLNGKTTWDRPWV